MATTKLTTNSVLNPKRYQRRPGIVVETGADMGVIIRVKETRRSRSRNSGVLFAGLRLDPS